MPSSRPASAPRVKSRPDAASEPRLCPLYRVLVHNDDVTPMDFVVDVLQEVFKLSSEQAVSVMLEAHHAGVALVAVEPLEKAEFHVEQARSMAGGRKYPLTFSIEPES